MKYLVVATALLASTTALADITVLFEESAPKDRFVIENTSDCPASISALTIDLAPAPAGLLFDVTASGAGVSVYQPFELVTGGEHVGMLPEVRDGDRAVRLSLKGLPSGGRIVFTADIDDTGGVRQTMVSDAEIAGARVEVETGGMRASGVFGAGSRARVAMDACMS